MIRKKVKRKTKRFDRLGRLRLCNYEAEEIIVESVGDLIDILAPYSRGASLYMIPPNDGDTIQQVQVMDIRPSKEIDADAPDDAHYMYKPIVFTIGTHGPHYSFDLFKKQQEREKAEMEHQLTEE